MKRTSSTPRDDDVLDAASLYARGISILMSTYLLCHKLIISSANANERLHFISIRNINVMHERRRYTPSAPRKVERDTPVLLAGYHFHGKYRAYIFKPASAPRISLHTQDISWGEHYDNFQPPQKMATRFMISPYEEVENIDYACSITAQKMNTPWQTHAAYYSSSWLDETCRCRSFGRLRMQYASRLIIT